MSNAGKIWWKESVVYQIYPRSFHDSNGDGIGDIQGIICKLDYIKNLGIDVIWISPMYQSPNDDNGYDISDYYQIMADFGDMANFDELLKQVHNRDMKLIMDLVVNHTSDEHTWFAESRKSLDNPYRDYYIWREGQDGGEPNNWGSWFGGPAWDYDAPTDMYYLHNFSPKQPDLNWENPNVRTDIYQMMTWWLDKGIDGFRMDVISLLSKDQTFPDGVIHDGVYGDSKPYCVHGPKIHEYLQEMNQEVLSKYDIMTVGEASCVTVDEAPLYSGYDRGELDMVFQFDHVDSSNGIYGKWTDERISLLKIKAVFNKWDQKMEGIGWNCLFWGNHDQPRAVSRFGNDAIEFRDISAKMLALCLLMMKGTPYIYQGDELGMTNAYFTKLDEYRDIETYNAYHKLVNEQGLTPDVAMRYIRCISRDNARTPMQWSADRNGGFTEGEPWIGVNQNYLEINADMQQNDPNSVYHFYRRLIELRHKRDILIYGDFAMIMEEDEKIFAYTRTLGDERLIVLCNFTAESVSYHVAGLDKKHVLINNLEEDEDGVLAPYQAVAFEV